MKVSCGDCSASFVAPDDKIRGRLVKYRCRKCGATIVADGTTLEPEEIDVAPAADAGELTSLPPPPRASGESVTHVRAAPKITEKASVPLDPPTIPLDQHMLVPPEPPSVPLPLLDEKQAGARTAAKKPVGDTSAAFSLGPSEQGSAARRKPKSLPPPAPTEDPIVLPPLPPVDEPPAQISSGMVDLQILSADVEEAPPSSGRVDFSSLVDASPSTAAPAGDFDWGGSLDAPAPAPLWETPAPEPEPATKKKAEKVEPLLSVSPVAAKPADASQGGDKKAPGWVWAAGALAVAAVVYFMFGRTPAADSPAASPARVVEPQKTAEPTKTEPTKTAEPAKTADPVPTASPPSDEPKKDEPKKDEPKKDEPVAKDEPKKAEPKKDEPVAKDEPKKVDPVAKDEPKKDEPKPVDVGAEFSKEAARAALGSAAAAAASCGQEDGPRGSGTVRVTFSSSGRATQALIQGPPFAGTSTGSCIAAKFRGISVPPFSGDPVTVTKTVTIQ